MENKYCGTCPKAKTCPIKNLMSDVGLNRAGFYGLGGVGLLPEYIHSYSLKEVENIKECPYVHQSIEKAITKTFETEDLSDANHFTFSCFARFVHCHVYTKTEIKKRQNQKKKAEDDFQKRVSEKLSTQPAKDEKPKTSHKIEMGKLYTIQEVRGMAHPHNIFKYSDEHSQALMRACMQYMAIPEGYGLTFSEHIKGNIRVNLTPLPKASNHVHSSNEHEDEKDEEYRLHKALIEQHFGSALDFLFEVEGKIKEGAIAYSKAVQLAFDTETPDRIAKQFSEVLTNAKYYADQAGQPITVFAEFKVKANGELTFDLPIEYNPKANKYEIQAIIRDKYNVVSYNGKYVSQMQKDHELRELLKQVRAGNFEGCKLK